MTWDIEMICIKKLLEMHEHPPICGCPNCKKERKENENSELREEKDEVVHDPGC